MKKRTGWLLISLGLAAGLLWWIKKQKDADDVD